MTFKNSDYQKNNSMTRYDSLEGWPEVHGYDFNKQFDFAKFMESFASTGIQATNLGKAIAIAKEMQKENATIFLSCTSNMGSSGVRDIIRYLVQNKHVHCLCMSAGAIEEDIIKTLRPFVHGSFDASGRSLFEKGIGRIGNILVPNDRYLYFEKFMKPFFEKIYSENKERELPFTPSEFIRELGAYADHDESILTWATRNKIPIFCPALTDGSIGDLLLFQRQHKKDFVIDAIGDSNKIMNLALNAEKTGAILLGGGSAKHFVLNANIFRDGLDYAIYLTTASESDASDSGGNPQEAISWAKINPNALFVKVVSDASITFPLLVAGAFQNHD